MPLFRHSGGIRQGIGEAIIHGFQPGGVGVTQPRHLHWGGLVGKDGKTIAPSVAGQIHQDIDLIQANTVGHLLVGHRLDWAPDVNHSFDAFRDGIRLRYLGVRIDIMEVALMVLQQGLKKQRDRMTAKIGRYVSDAQFSLGLPRV